MAGEPDKLSLPPCSFAQVFAKKGAVVFRFTFKTIFDPLEIDQLQTDMERIVHTVRAAYYVIDMSNVEFISSGFLGLLISASATLKSMGAKVRVCCLTPGIARVIKTTQLDRVLDIRADLEQSVADLPE